MNLIIKKRNGALEDFDLKKIGEAITKAMLATKTLYTIDVIDLLALRVSAKAQEYADNGIVELETVQDVVETILDRKSVV